MQSLTPMRHESVARIITLSAVGAIYYFLLPEIQNRPLTAIFVGIALVVLFAVTQFLIGVWKQELEDDAKKVLGNGIRVLASSIFHWGCTFSPGAQKKYFQYLIRSNAVLNDRSFELSSDNRLELRQVFVELRIAPGKNRSRTLGHILSKSEFQGNRSIWQFLYAFRNQELGLAIIGPPGSGKTTLLHHVLLTYAENNQWRHLTKAKVPLFLYLREHAGTIAANADITLGEIAQDAVAKQLMRYAKLALPKMWFESQLRRGNCIVLLDGLDEIPDIGLRKAMSTWVDDQIQSYCRCRFLITARPQGFESAPLVQTQILNVQPFNSSQVRQFVHRWYLANEIVSSGNRNNRAVRIRSCDHATDLLKRLAAMPALNDLTVNPLLLTMITMVHRNHAKLPGSRVQLYAAICHVLLDRRRDAGGAKSTLTCEQQLSVLRPLAASMMARRVRDLGTDEINSLIATALRKVGLSESQRITFLADLQANSGLLIEHEPGKWGFAHLTFQEYLTSTQWAEDWHEERPWAELVHDDWWHEVIRLYCIQPKQDASPVVLACLAKTTSVTLELLVDCLANFSQLSPALQASTKSLFSKMLKPPFTENWNLAVETNIKRRTRVSWNAIATAVEIDFLPLTNCELQLFLQELAPNDCAFRPKHWLGGVYPEGQAEAPAVGVSFEAARSFCFWITARQNPGTWKYRLPNVREIDCEAHVSLIDKFAVWCTNDVGSPILYGPATEKRNQVVSQLINASRSRTSQSELAFYAAIPEVPRNFMEVASLLDRDLPTLINNDEPLVHAFVTALCCALGRTPRNLRSQDMLKELKLAFAPSPDLNLALTIIVELSRNLHRDFSLRIPQLVPCEGVKARPSDWAALLSHARDLFGKLEKTKTLDDCRLQVSVACPLLIKIIPLVSGSWINRIILLHSLLRLIETCEQQALRKSNNRYQATVFKLILSGLLDDSRFPPIKRRLLKAFRIKDHASTLSAAAFWQKEFEFLLMEEKLQPLGTVLLARERAFH